MRGLECALDLLASDRIEDDAFRFGWFDAHDVREVPCDGFAFTVEVGREPDRVRLLGEFLQLRDGLLLVRENFVAGFEVVLEVDSRNRHLDPLGARGRKVADMADRCSSRRIRGPDTC